MRTSSSELHSVCRSSWIRIVGLGRWGFDWAQHVYSGSSDVEPVAFVDKDPEALARAQSKLGTSPGKFFPALSDALAATDADAVVVALPLVLHAAVAREALLAGKHVVLEKPFTQTLEEAHDLVGIAEKTSRVLMVSQKYRFFPAPQAAFQFVRDAWFGQLHTVQVDFRLNAVAEGYGSRHQSLSNPLLADMAVHHFDLMRMVIGEDPVELSCRAWVPRGSPYQMPPCAVVVLTFPSGIVVSYRGSWVDQAPKTPWAGRWQMDFEQGSLFWTARGDRPLVNRQDRVSIQRLNSEPEDVDLEPMPKYDRLGVLHAFASAIRSGTAPSFFPSGRDNLSTLSIVEAAIRSSLQGGASVQIGNAKSTATPQI
ncbi:MAG: Gfo/Idh/MocA family oxidoreductase [Verrucomicrobia bacterium]|nr:Gfo/Idh/MocA family oxidoreductase [Verrucomicrobiota bacterium]